MNVKSAEKKENSTVELLIEVPAEEFDAAVERAYRKNRGRISVPGFRKGKAPRKVIEGMYGANVFYEDAIEDVYPAAYSDAVKDQGLDVVAYPAVEVVSAGREGLTFKATVTVKPPVTLGQYKGLAAPKAEVEITDKDIEREMAPLVERATRLVSVERPAQMGDTAVLDFDGTKDGERFEGGQGSNYSLELGSHTFVPGFEDGVVGMKAGDEKDIDITFPKEYPEELAGKDAVFHVKVHEVKEKSVPELDDEFAKDVSEFETLDELKKDLEEKLRERRQQQADQEYESALIEQVCDNMSVELPDAMVDFRVDEMVEDLARRVTSQGIPFDQYMKYMGTDAAQMKAQMRPNAIARIKADLAMEAIAQAEGLSISDEEIDEEIKTYVEQSGMDEAKVREMADLEAVRKDLLLRKAAKLVLDNGKVGEAPKKADEGESAAEQADGQSAGEEPAAKKTTKKSSAKKEDGEGKSAPKKPAAKRSAKKAAESAPESAEEKPGEGE